MLPALSEISYFHKPLALGSDRTESSSDVNWSREYLMEKEGLGEDILATTELYSIYTVISGFQHTASDFTSLSMWPDD